ncbi:hypothetical protein ACFSBG_03670 [Georgenia yuyongxinii]|uniref:hypothetical protein n=1 Tax=Georgenia yuyongxinii TaxID=2589797 RepID=UPI00143DA7CD|nr:hypothetical protein [Georgenia yuyongxinii]
MKIALAQFAAEAESGAEAAAVNPWVLGLVAFSVFVLLLLLTYSFRNTYHRHAANKPAR